MDPIELSSITAFIIDPATGQRMEGTGFTTNSNMGQWNQTISHTSPAGVRRIDWPETAKARVRNAPIVYAGILGALIFGASRLRK